MYICWGIIFSLRKSHSVAININVKKRYWIFKIQLIIYFAIPESGWCCGRVTHVKASAQHATSSAATHIESVTGNYSCLKVDLIFTRDRAFYFTTVFIPGIILVTSSFITFWLEWNAVPARVMIGKFVSTL